MGRKNKKIPGGAGDEAKRNSACLSYFLARFACAKLQLRFIKGKCNQPGLHQQEPCRT